MSAHRTHRPDRNAEEIITAFRGLGCYVANTGVVGNGFPDLVIGVANNVALVEIKAGNGKLTEKQIVFHAEWPGSHLHTIRSLEDAGALVKAMREA